MKITFHTFAMGDVQDPDVYAAMPILKWQHSAQGQWVMQHAHDITYTTAVGPHSFGYQVSIHGTLDDPVHVTEYFLRWPI